MLYNTGYQTITNSCQTLYNIASSQLQPVRERELPFPLKMLINTGAGH